MGFFSKVWRKIKGGAKKVFRGVKKVVKKVWKSPIGKIAVIAAAIYTGGAALAAWGGVASASAGGWAGFTAALGSPSTVVAGYKWAGAALASKVGLGGGQAAAPSLGTTPSIPGLAKTVTPEIVKAGSQKGILSSVAGLAGKGTSWMQANPIPTLVGAQAIGGALTARGQQEQYEQQRDDAMAMREQDRADRDRAWNFSLANIDRPEYDPERRTIRYVPPQAA